MLPRVRIHRVTLLGTVLVAALALVALTSAAAPAQIEINHLAYTSHGEAQHNWIRSMAQAYEAQRPNVKVNVIIGNQEQFAVMVAGGAPPEVVDLPTLDMGTYIANNFFADLRPFLERDGLLREYSPIVLEQLRQPDGGLFALPKNINVVITFFNVNMFNEGGVPTPIELGEGWTWESALDSARKLTVEKNGDGTPDQFGMDRSYAGWEWAVHQAGGRFYDDLITPTRSLWNSPEVRTAIEWVNSIHQAGVTPRWQVPNWQSLYFWLNGTAIDIVDQPPIIGAYLTNVSFDWDMALQPKGPYSRATRTSIGGWMVPKGVANLPEVWEWLKFISNEENTARMVRESTLVPARTSLQPLYVELVGIEDKNWQVIFTNPEAPNGYPGYFVDNRLNPRSFNGPITQIFSGAVPVQAWLEETHRQTQAIIDEINAGRSN